MFSQLFKLTALLAVAGLVNANCHLRNQLKESEKVKETRPEVCQTMGEDRWTFAMINSMVGVPTFDGDNAFAGIAGSDAFVIYDNDCIPHGVYEPGNKDTDCGIPYEIQGNFLPYTLIITEVSMMMGGGSFKFAYADGTYQIGEDGCVCSDISGSSLRAEQACGCSFPINSEPE